MNILDDIQNRAEKLKKRVIFPESKDPRVLRAVQFLEKYNICFPVLVGDPAEILRIAEKEEISLSPRTEIIAFKSFDQQDKIAGCLFDKEKQKGATETEVRQALKENPLLFAAVLVKTGFADGAVAGSVGTTGDVIRAALKGIGLASNTTIVSSIFLMALPDGRVFTYGDCGVVPYPDAEQLADIAIQSSRTHRLLTGAEPVTAMLSFSTKGSARHERVELVREALQIAKDKDPRLKIDGEFQFDAALVRDVAKRKAPGSEVAGKANVFIFPNLDAGNIAYKITERLAGATATGPILQGLAKPMMDLSRGCSWKDIVNAACVAVLMGNDES